MVDYVRFAPIEGQGWYGPWDDTEWPFNALNYVLAGSAAWGGASSASMPACNWLATSFIAAVRRRWMC